MPRALGFYRDLLGAEVTYQFPPEGDPGYVALRLGYSQLGLGLDADAVADAPAPALRPVGLCRRLRRRGRPAARRRRRVTEEPEDQPWGERVARVLDPDGNEIIVGSPPPTR